MNAKFVKLKVSCIFAMKQIQILPPCHIFCWSISLWENPRCYIFPQKAKFVCYYFSVISKFRTLAFLACQKKKHSRNYNLVNGFSAPSLEQSFGFAYCQTRETNNLTFLVLFVFFFVGVSFVLLRVHLSLIC